MSQLELATKWALHASAYRQ